MNRPPPPRLEWDPVPITEVAVEARAPGPLPGALFLALLGGAAGLGHALLWMRRMVDVLGADADTFSAVIAAFFLGLTGGAWLAARWQIARPWRGVAWAQLGVAVMAGAMMGSAHLPPHLIEKLGSSLKWLLPLGLIAPPAFAMGLVVPWMTRAIGAQRAVWLYAVHLLGGVIGLALTLLKALPIFGLAGASIALLAINLICALCALLFSRNAPLQPPDAAPDGQAPDYQTLGLAFGAGFLGLGGVVLLQLQLAQVTIHSHFLSAGICSLVLTVLALAAALAPLLSKLGKAVLPVVLTLAALGCAVEPVLFIVQRGGLSSLPFHLGPWDYAGSVLRLSAASALGFLLPAAMALPLLIHAKGGAKRTSIGVLLAVNGLGAWLGVEFAQGLLAPLFGLWLSMSVLAAGYAICALCVASRRAFFFLGLGLALAVCESLKIGGPLPHAALGQNERLLEWELGREGVVAAIETTADDRRILFNNTYTPGGARAQFDQERQALLPILLHGQAEKVATLGIATGSPVAGATLDPAVAQIEAIEGSPLVLEFAREFFGDFNRRVFENPRVHVSQEDARWVIARRPASFDVVIGDLILPWRTGDGRLFTKEHFVNVRASLREDGIFCQWLPLFALTRVQFECIARTFRAVFPEAWLVRDDFYTGMPVLGLIGGRAFEKQDWNRTRAACERVRAAGLTNDPLLRHVEGVAMCAIGPLPAPAPGPRNTLSNAWLEWDAARNVMGMREPWFTGVPCATFLREIQRASAPQLPANLRAAQASGQNFLTLEIARTAGLPNANQVAAEVRASLPAALREDKGAHWNQWPMRFPPDGLVR